MTRGKINMKYVFNDNCRTYYKEYNNTGLIQVIESGNQIYLNETCNIIYKLPKENTESDNIVMYMHNLYKDVPLSTLNEDVSLVLHMLSTYGIIEILIDKISVLNKNIEYVWENTYKIASKFIFDNLLANPFSFLTTTEKNYFNSINMRLHSFNNQERFVVAYKNDTIIGILSYVPVGIMSSVCNINNIIFVKDLSFDDCCDCLKNLIAFVKETSKLTINKFRINVISKLESLEDDNIKCAMNIGFKVETILQKEYLDSNLFMLTYLL